MEKTESRMDFNKIMIVKLSMSKWNPITTDEDVNAETYRKHHIDEEAGSWRKFLMAREAIKIYSDVHAKIYRWHRENTGRHPDRGLALVTLNHLENVYRPQMEKFIKEFWGAVDTFEKNYPEYIENAKEILKDTFKESDYPPVNRIRQEFNISLTYHPYPTSDHLVGKIRNDLYQEIKTELDRNNEVVKNVFMRDLWDRCYKVVSHLVERLQNADKTFRDSLTGNISELCSTLRSLNPNGDSALNEMVKTLESKLANLDPEYLRKDRKIRAEATQTAETILKQIDVQRRRIKI